MITFRLDHDHFRQHTYGTPFSCGQGNSWAVGKRCFTLSDPEKQIQTLAEKRPSQEAEPSCQAQPLSYKMKEWVKRGGSAWPKPWIAPGECDVKRTKVICFNESISQMNTSHCTSNKASNDHFCGQAFREGLSFFLFFQTDVGSLSAALYTGRVSRQAPKDSSTCSSLVRVSFRLARILKESSIVHMCHGKNFQIERWRRAARRTPASPCEVLKVRGVFNKTSMAGFLEEVELVAGTFTRIWNHDHEISFSHETSQLWFGMRFCHCLSLM